MNNTITSLFSLLAQGAEAATVAEPVKETAKDPNIFAPVLLYFTENGVNLLMAIIIFVLGRWACKLITDMMGKIFERSKVDVTLQKFLSNLTYMALMTLVVIVTITKLGVPGASLVAVVGAAGLAVGLALQGSLSNFAAGVLLIFFKPIRVGDSVEVGGAAGTVMEIQIFNTLLNTGDNIRKVIPNSQVLGSTIVNYSTNPTRRVEIKVGVSYKDDLQKTRQVIQAVIKEDPRILADPAPVVAVLELGDSSVNFVVRPWVKNSDFWPVYFDLIEKIKVALDKNGISIPFPQRDIHLYQVTK